MTRTVLIVLVLAAVAFTPRPSPPKGLRVASKKDTESVILGEILVQSLRAKGISCTHVAQLGGTTLVYDALRRGEIDLYPEYTGTLRQELFAGKNAESDADLQKLLSDERIVMGKPLGFNNSYALAVRRRDAERYGLVTIDDLAKNETLRFGLSSEFIDRNDGWKNLRKVYPLDRQQPAGMDHEIAYESLRSGAIDVTDVYTTDAEVAQMDLVVLKDNRDFFPSYEAVVLWRDDLPKRYPEAVEQVARIESQISAETMTRMNAEAKSGEASEAQVAAKFLKEKLNIDVTVEDRSVESKIWRHTVEHIDLVRRSLIPAIFLAVPLGVLAARRPRLGQFILGAVGVVQTIPALALLVLLIAPLAWLGLNTLGGGSATAIVALFLYSLLPIVRNTATGLVGIAPEYHESAIALGLSPWFRLWKVELPLASPSILAGIKTAAVLNVGFATLGALVGAGGYGQPILTGIRLNSTSLIMQGAVPAACLAILLQVGFELAERWLVPAGLRPTARSSNSEQIR